MSKLSKEETKKRKAEYTKKWRLKHPLYNKQWKETNKEHVSKYSKSYLKTQHGRASYLIQGYRREDRIHNRGECNLTVQWIVDNIFTKPCAHCGKTGWKIIGCNRIDNSKPHTTDNVEPCCVDCNKKLGGEYNKSRYSKNVYQYTLDGKLVKVWSSTCECHRNGYDKANISACCRGKAHYNTYKGYKWSYTPL